MLKAYSIYDKKTGKYMTPFFVEHLAMALRSIQTSLSRDQSNLRSYPHDFALYEIGHFNQDEGLLISSPPPTYVEEIANLMPPKET